jgi:hypothetical protein
MIMKLEQMDHRVVTLEATVNLSWKFLFAHDRKIEKMNHDCPMSDDEDDCTNLLPCPALSPY